LVLPAVAAGRTAGAEPATGLASSDLEACRAAAKPVVDLNASRTLRSLKGLASPGFGRKKRSKSYDPYFMTPLCAG